MRSNVSTRRVRNRYCQVDRGADARQLERLHGAPAAPVRTAALLCREILRADELVERGGQLLAERRRAQHRVDAGQVVVHPRAVDADDLAQRFVDRRRAGGADSPNARPRFRK